MTDKQLAQACAELNEALLRSLPAPEECDHPFSRRFERKMNRLIRRTDHPLPYRLLQRAAAFLLVLFLGFMTVLAVSPDARAAFASWIRETYESFFVYSFTEEAEGPAPNMNYYISEIPDGYVEAMASYDEYTGHCVYVNEDNASITLLYMHGDSSAFFVEKDGYTVKSITVAGHSGELFADHISDPNNGILWIDEEKQIMFVISGPFTGEELIAIAESVKEK